LLKNTTSSSGIYSESFSEGSSTLQASANVYGLYLIRFQNSSCNCHKTNWFNIFINTDKTSSSIAVSVTAHEHEYSDLYENMTDIDEIKAALPG